VAEIETDLELVEARMRPGRLSRSGFLGPHESLRAVMAADAAAMRDIALSFEAVGSRLSSLLDAALDSPGRAAIVQGTYEVRLQQFLGFQICPWARRGQCEGPALVYASVDWTITDLHSGASISGPGMIVHLMGDHHFCEGRESPRRVEPVRLARFLGLTSAD
jgi:hypothetical protein